MDANLIAAEVLEENFQIECETVGPTNLEDIVEGEVSFADAEYGSNMDLGQTIQLLVIAAAFVKTTIDIYRALKKEICHKPDEVEILLKILRDKKVMKNLDKNVQEKLVKAVIKRMK